MSKFDEILNSSDASDALLGEQIDKANEKIEKLDTETVKVGEWNISETNYTTKAANTLEYSGISVVIPPKSVYMITINCPYQSSPATAVALSWDSSKVTDGRLSFKAEGSILSVFIYNYTETNYPYYIWTSHSATGTNKIVVAYKKV